LTKEQYKAVLVKANVDEANQVILLNAFDESINEQIEIGKNHYKNKDSEKLALKAKFKELGYDPDIHGSLDDFINKQKQNRDASNTDKLTISQLSEKVTAFESSLNAEKLRTETLQKDNAKEKITTKLTKSIGAKIYGSEYLIKDLINEGKVDVVDNSVVFKDGDTITTFDTGVKNLLEAHKENLKVDQNPGSSSTPAKEFTTEKVKNLSVADALSDLDNLKKMYNMK